MLYKLTKQERDFAQGKIQKFLNDKQVVSFTGTTISPYNLREVLLDNGFQETYPDCNASDHWWIFIHPKLGEVMEFFNAESFELVLGCKA